MTRRMQGGERKNRFRRILMAGRPWIECHYCGRHLTLLEITLDHVVPLSKGGPWVCATSFRHVFHAIAARLT